jgi:hypothetical protein
MKDLRAFIAQVEKGYMRQRRCLAAGRLEGKHAAPMRLCAASGMVPVRDVRAPLCREGGTVAADTAADARKRLPNELVEHAERRFRDRPRGR